MVERERRNGTFWKGSSGSGMEKALRRTKWRFGGQLGWENEWGRKGRENKKAMNGRGEKAKEYTGPGINLSDRFGEICYCCS